MTALSPCNLIAAVRRLPLFRPVGWDVGWDCDDPACDCGGAEEAASRRAA